jgi:hypothetical protein
VRRPDPYDPETYRWHGAGGHRRPGKGAWPLLPKRHKGEAYFGPVPGRWLTRACALPGKAWAVASALYFEGMTNRRSAVVTLRAKTRRLFGLANDNTVRKALQSLQRANLIHVEGRPGAHRRITILDVSRGETP